MRTFKLIALLLFWNVQVFGQHKIGITYPDSLRTSRQYFSPYAIYQTIPDLKSIINIGETFDSTIYFDYFYDDNRETDDSLGTIKDKQKGLTVIIDTGQEINESIFFTKSEKVNGLYSSPKTIFYLNSKNGLVKIPCTQDTNLLFKATPVYILNDTKDRKAIFLKSRYIEMTQEAMDKNGKWKPIESTIPFSCGMGFGWRGLDPGQYVVTSIIKYKGNYKTLIRVKLKSGSTTYYSKAFNGSINYSQLNGNKIKYIDELPYEKK